MRNQSFAANVNQKISKSKALKDTGVELDSVPEVKYEVYDLCATISCTVAGETCQSGRCMCGTGPSCNGNDQAPTCDAANNRCICGSSPSCEMNLAAPTCDVANNKCICGTVGRATMGCTVAGETCKAGTCMCGTAASCNGSMTAPTCDLKNNQCICGDVGSAFTGCTVPDETCNDPTSGECKCGTAPSCEKDDAGNKCIKDQSKCVCEQENIPCPTGKVCNEIGKCEDKKTCNVAGEEPDPTSDGECKCGTGPTCENNDMGNKCIKDQNECVCEQENIPCQNGKVCNANNGKCEEKNYCNVPDEEPGSDGECKCGSNPTCENNPVGNKCIKNQNKCVCDQENQPCQNGKVCNANNGKCEEKN